MIAIPLVFVMTLACFGAPSQDAPTAQPAGSQKFDMNFSLPEIGCEVPLGARVPIAGSLQLLGDGPAPNGLLVVLEQERRGTTSSLCQTIITLASNKHNEWLFCDTLSVD